MSMNAMKARIVAAGGTRKGRMEKGKVDGLKYALNNSYDRQDIIFNGRKTPCLIMSDYTKMEEDNKKINIENKYAMKPGDIFTWETSDFDTELKSSSNWIVYLENRNDTAYFSAEIKQCSLYPVKVGDKEIFGYIKGPSETSITWTKGSPGFVNELNYTLNMFLPLTEETKGLFKRFSFFNYGENNDRWEVQAVDTISTPGIIQVAAKEYYNTDVVEPDYTETDPDFDVTIVPYIDGDEFISIYSDNAYELKNYTEVGLWKVNSKLATIKQSTETSVVVETLGRSGTFDLTYNDFLVKHITIKAF